MNYILKIIIDDLVKEPYAIVSEDIMNDNMISVEVYTSSKSKLDFKKMEYTSLDQNALDNFLLGFSYGKDVIDNASFITIRPKLESVDKDLNFNDIIYSYINNNQHLLNNNNIIINAGVYDYDQNEYDHIKQFIEDDNVNFIMANLQDTLPVKKIGKCIKVINKIVDETKKHNELSSIEKAMYSYDLLRINLAKTLENNTEAEKEVNELANSYLEPSDYYAVLYHEILTRLGIKSVCAIGEFYSDETRRFTIAYIEDPKYDIEGVYYFDPAINSVRNIRYSLSDSLPEIEGINPILDTLKIYNGFAKTKLDMHESGYLNFDFMFADFDESYLNAFELTNKNALGVMAMNVNNVSFFVDERNVINDLKIFENEEAKEDLKIEIERYLDLFNRNISAEEFLEILFNVRKLEYQENKEIFKLSIEELKDILYNSRVVFSNSTIEVDIIELDDDVEEEEIKNIIRDDIDSNFEEFTNKHDIKNKILQLKLSIYKKENPDKKDKNN